MSSIAIRAELSSKTLASGIFPRCFSILLLSMTRICSQRTTESCVSPWVVDSKNTCDGKIAFLILDVKGAMMYED